MKRQIMVLAEDNSPYDEPFKEHGDITHDPDHIAAVDLVVFTGGTDVDPALYGQGSHLTTSPPDVNRDKLEQEVYNYAVLLGIPMAGICRGAQFLCVMNGGELVQHVTNHEIHGTHSVTTSEGEQIEVTSTHHQMMNPYVLGAEESTLLAWTKGLSDRYEDEYGNDIHNGKYPGGEFPEPEVVWWPRTRCLCAQYHPEYMDKDSDGWKYYQKLLEEYVL